MGFVKKITSWSISRYRVYVQCPLKAKLAFIDKIKEPPNEAMARGSRIGELAEKFLKGELKQLPAELKLFKSDFDQARRIAKKRTNLAVIEETWAVTKDWVATRFDDWTGAWLRVKLDWAYSEDHETLYITDWKTGKFRPDDLQDYLEQLEIYALIGLILKPHIKRAIPCLKYLDLGRTYPDPEQGEKLLVYTQQDVERLKKRWLKLTKPMLSDAVFAPKPNRFCNWCHYRASNKANGGGQCKF